MTKILLTGATGFLGRACLEALLQNTDWEIHAIYRNRPHIEKNRVIWHACDILQKQTVSDLLVKTAPDYLIHLAWIVDHQVFWSSELNIDHMFATVHLYQQFSINGGKRAVFLGTCSEYDQAYAICDEEQTPLNPNTLYGKCKKQTFELLTQLKMNHPDYAEFSWVRLFNIYGPYEYHERLIPYIFCSYLQKKAPLLNNPNIVRDHIYVENAAELLINLIMSNVTSAINFGSNNVLSISALGKLIHQNFFREQAPPIESAKLHDNDDTFTPKLNKLEKIVIKPLLSFERSLEKTYHWWVNKIKGNI